MTLTPHEAACVAATTEYLLKTGAALPAKLAEVVQGDGSRVELTLVSS